MSPKEKIDKAAEATKEILDHWNEAQAQFGDFHVNGFGVHADPGSLRYYLKNAAERINKALTIVDQTEWPTPEDYDAAED